MPWYSVIIAKSDVADATATALMNKYEKALRAEIEANGLPDNALVAHGTDADGNHVFHFNPAAAAIAIAREVFGEFNASPSLMKPNLEGFREVQGLTAPRGNRIRAIVKTRAGWTSETEVPDPPPEMIQDTVFSNVPRYHGRSDPRAATLHRHIQTHVVERKDCVFR